MSEVEIEINDALKDLAIERKVLGTMLFNYEFYQFSTPDLSVDIFFAELHQEFYAMLSFIYEEEGFFDIDRVHAQIKFEKKTEIFPDEFINNLLCDFDPNNFHSYCKLLKAYYLRRELLTIGSEILVGVNEGEKSPHDLYDKTLIDLNKISEKASRIKIITGYQGTKEYENMSPIQRKSTGLALVDYKFNGGVVDTDLVVIGARPGMGKTALICSASYNIAKTGGNVLIFSLEMSYLQIFMRQLSIHTNETYRNIESKNYEAPDDFSDKFKDFKDKIAGQIYYCDFSNLTFNQIVNEVKRLSRTIKFEAIYVDYIQKTLGENNQQLRIPTTNAIQAYKRCAKDTKIPFYVLSQLTRAVDDRPDPKPQQHDLMESGGIEAEADRILLLYRPIYYAQRREDQKFKIELINGQEQSTENWGQVIITKDRHDGGTGELWMPFEGRRMYWCDYEHQMGKNNRNERNPARYPIIVQIDEKDKEPIAPKNVQENLNVPQGNDSPTEFKSNNFDEDEVVDAPF